MPPATSASFIAVQCFQCSTMQVKQQKKSSNKWTCVVCNEKQSVRKVYAQGSMAKDVRKFVQSFNMSRKFIDEEEENLSAMVTDVEEEGGGCSGNGRKRRCDWTEYLDPQEDDEETAENTDEEGEIVKEEPLEMFKKPKLKQSTGLQSRERDGGKELLLKPLFPKRNTTTNMKATKKTTSKWSEYLTEEEGENEETMSALDIEAAPIIQRGNDSQMVEEEIHPDFM